MPKQNPIIPCPRSLLGEGPLQDLTTQKHDFVVKPFSKRNLIVPPGKIMKITEPIDQDTVQKLSFQKPDLMNFQPAKSCKPYTEYRRSEGNNITFVLDTYYSGHILLWSFHLTKYSQSLKSLPFILTCFKKN